MEIVYCGGCGKVLREDDFARGRARMLDHRPWCAECKPPDKTPVASGAGGKRTGSSAKHARVTPGTSRRESARGGLPAGVLWGLGLAGIALVAYLALGSGGVRNPAPPPEPPLPRPAPPRPASDDAERNLQDLEAFASLSPPDRVLARCDELRAGFKGTTQEARFRAIEAAARQQKDVRQNEEKLTRELDEIRKLIDEDPRYERADLVIRRIKAAQAIAGPRAPELSRRLAAYEKSREASPHHKHAGPFPLDAEGFIRTWLILGVFPSNPDRGLETDFLGGEANADPVAGQAVGTRRWGAFASPASKVDFFQVPHLGIKRPADHVVAYAACLLEVPSETPAQFRVGSDDGCALWVYGTAVGRSPLGRPLVVDNDRYEVPLPAGLHRILLKVENQTGDFEFLLRVVRPDGQGIPGLRVWN